MNHGALEHDIRSLAGVLACQFTPTDVFVLVEPTADAAAVTAAVEGVLLAAAEARRVAIIGGTTGAAGAGGALWFRKRHALVLGAAASFLAAATAAAVTGVFTADNHPQPVAARPAVRPSGRPASTTTTTTTTTTLPGSTTPDHGAPTGTVQAPAPTTSTTVGAQIIKVVLPAPLPSVGVGNRPPVRTTTTSTPVPPTTTPVVKPPPPPPPPPVCDPAHVITSFRFTINGRPAATLHRQLSEGDVVMAFFTLGRGCKGVPVSLVSHTSPDPVFVKDHVSQQRVFQAARASLDAGDHVLGPVIVPDCYFQVDFEATAQGSLPGFTYSSAVGGTTPCDARPDGDATRHAAAPSPAGAQAADDPNHR